MKTKETRRVEYPILVVRRKVGNMSARFVGMISIVVLVLMAAGVVSCGDSSTSEQTTAVEIQTLPDDGTEPFYRFDEPPVLVAYEAPGYPEDAKRSGLEGSVMVKVLVGADGSIEETAVLESTDPVFEGPALAAAATCEFKPARLDGEPTKSRVAIPYQFRLENKKVTD